MSLVVCYTNERTLYTQSSRPNRKKPSRKRPARPCPLLLWQHPCRPCFDAALVETPQSGYRDAVVLVLWTFEKFPICCRPLLGCCQCCHCFHCFRLCRLFHLRLRLHLQLQRLGLQLAVEAWKKTGSTSWLFGEYIPSLHMSVIQCKPPREACTHTLFNDCIFNRSSHFQTRR